MTSDSFQYNNHLFFGRGWMHHYTAIMVGKMSEECKLENYLLSERMTSHIF